MTVTVASREYDKSINFSRPQFSWLHAVHWFLLYLNPTMMPGFNENAELVVAIILVMGCSIVVNFSDC
jgi:hypothetical protein